MYRKNVAIRATKKQRFGNGMRDRGRRGRKGTYKNWLYMLMFWAQ